MPFSDYNINIFEKAALEYDAWFIRHEAAYRAELAAIQGLLSVGSQGLEIGSARGVLLAPWASRWAWNRLGPWQKLPKVGN